MELTRGEKLDQAMRRHPQTRPWLTTWRRRTEAADWANLVEVRRDFPSADGVPVRSGQGKVVVTVFNVCGNDYRLLTFIHYHRQQVVVVDVLTHAEYSKGHWKNRL